MKGIAGMDNFVDERDYKLLEADKYTFFVLKQIMGGACRLLLSDHKRMILCFTKPPFPVWIWTPDDAAGEEMEQAYLLAKENGLITGGYNFNVKYSLAEYLIKRAAEDGIKMSKSMNIFAYDCFEPQKPDMKADGTIYRCESKDLDELVLFLDMFHKEVGIDQKDIAGYKEDARAHIDSGKMYFWKDGQGNNVASCKYEPTGDMASVNLVFTRPDFRRKHYAENLVYQVTMKAKEEGYVPMLYTNADYVASNACYEKIGYVCKGKLCTISIISGGNSIFRR